MPEQPPLFEFETLHVMYERSRNHRLKVTDIRLTVLDHYGEPVCTIQWVGGGKPPKRKDMERRLWNAYHHRNHRLFGDEYQTPDGTVFYWTDLVL